MQIHELQVSKPKKEKRIGRGGKRGSYSGRGIKGQKARAGRKIKPAIHEIILKLPKLRGVKNKPKSPKPYNVKISDLISKIEMLNFKGTISIKTLKQLELVPIKYKGKVKIIGQSEKLLPLNISGIEISKKLKEKIVALGGKLS